MSKTEELEDLTAMAYEDENINETEQNQEDKEQNNTQNIINETQQLLKQPIELAIQNLGLEEEEVIEAAKQLFETGDFVKTFDLPFGLSFTLKTRKVFDDIDYFTFIKEAIEQNVTIDQFEFMNSIRNLAHAIQRIGKEDYSELSVQERYEILKQKPASLIGAIMARSKKFWRISIILIHSELVDFLLRKTQ